MTGHLPVMQTEIVQSLCPAAGTVLVDGTFGGGGHAGALLEAADCVVWGIDRDPAAIARGSQLVQATQGRLRLLHGRFGEMRDLLMARGVSAVDGIVLDLGVSSYQLDDPARGFSFRHAGPLDMRMGAAGTTAQDLVNSAPERELAGIIYRLGEERLARRIARAIVEARAKAPINSTYELAEIVRGAIPGGRPGGRQRIDPATRTFQALRIEVNDELGELERGLRAAEQLLREGGRLAVISFHSLEDRPVKHFLRQRSRTSAVRSRHLPPTDTPHPTFKVVSKRPLRPTSEEVARNPRARSARLRVAERTSAPAWPPAWPNGAAA